MPSSIISHQAPALLIKLKFPNRIDGTAICLATIIPDFNIFFDPFFPISFRNITHSFLGLLIWTIPLTIFSTMLFSKYIAPWLANLAKKDNFFTKSLSYFGVDSWENLKLKRFDKRFFITGTYSALIGGITHLLLDLPAHETIELFFPLILTSPDFILYPIVDFGTISTFRGEIEMVIAVYHLVWILESVLLIIPSLYMLRYIKKNKLLEVWYSKEEKLI